MSSVTLPALHSEALPIPRLIGASSEEYAITDAEEEVFELLSTSDNRTLPSREDGSHLQLVNQLGLK